jgi:hypothetical protein
MLDACYTESAVQTAVDLANTLKPIKEEDALETVAQLRDFLDNHPPAGPAGPPSSAADQVSGLLQLTRADLAEVRALRETVRAVLERANTDAAGIAALITTAGGPRSPPTPTAARHTWPRPRSAHWPP